MAMILALNGVPMDGFGNFRGFGEFGAASTAVAGLQTALANFGKQIGDAALKAIKVDGLIGPKTTAAANRALRVHIGAGQAPAELRTGVLTQAQVADDASQIAQLVNTEAQRRGFTVAKAPTTVKKPVAKKTTAVATYIPPAASAPSASSYPDYGPPALPPVTQTAVAVPTSKTYVVAPPSGGMDVESIVKWSAIGLGVVALLGGAYYVVQKRRAGQPAMAGSDADPRDQERELWIRSNGSLYDLYQRASQRGVSLRTFIARNRRKIDAVIRKELEPMAGSHEDPRDKERELWVYNNGALYDSYRRAERRGVSLRTFIARHRTKIDAVIRKELEL